MIIVIKWKFHSDHASSVNRRTVSSNERCTQKRFPLRGLRDDNNRNNSQLVEMPQHLNWNSFDRCVLSFLSNVNPVDLLCFKIVQGQASVLISESQVYFWHQTTHASGMSDIHCLSTLLGEISTPAHL